MFINKLNQLYKPERDLYYIDAKDEIFEDFTKGHLPDFFHEYDSAFGAYDQPGLFYIKSLDRLVIGVEFRPDDERIAYPEGLKTVRLKESFFYQIEVDEEVELSFELIRKLFNEVATDNDALRNYSSLTGTDDPEVVSVFHGFRKTRLLYEWKLADDMAFHVMNDNIDAFDKDYLYKKSFIDFVTGHYNWNHLVPYLEMPMDKGIRDYAFVHFDIKDFKIINEVYGHVAANKVLSNVVKAMNDAPFVYTSGRCHNDNFAMIIKDMPEKDMIRTLIVFFNKISRLEEDINYRIYYRCGVVPMQRAMLFGNRVADAAKLAQSLGTSHNETEITFYTDKMHNDISWGNFIKAYLETAIMQDEFVVYLQPKINAGTGKVKGAEALIRWNFKKREMLPPSKFIPFFEKNGYIGKIDDIVMMKVCQALARWKSEGKPLYPVSVNLSRTRLGEPGLINHLTDIADCFGISHEYIDFELTESATYNDSRQMLRVLNELKNKGFRISMDDFGTGYSSLSLLTKIPIDTLKIDKSFVDKLTESGERSEDTAVLRHIISLACDLGFVCLAEGAENNYQVSRLAELGCELIQGYYFSKPVPISEYEEKFLV